MINKHYSHPGSGEFNSPPLAKGGSRNWGDPRIGAFNSPPPLQRGGSGILGVESLTLPPFSFTALRWPVQRLPYYPQTDGG